MDNFPSISSWSRIILFIDKYLSNHKGMDYFSEGVSFEPSIGRSEVSLISILDSLLQLMHELGSE